jgi:hypothetical protein
MRIFKCDLIDLKSQSASLYRMLIYMRLIQNNALNIKDLYRIDGLKEVTSDSGSIAVR